MNTATARSLRAPAPPQHSRAERAEPCREPAASRNNGHAVFVAYNASAVSPARPAAPRTPSDGPAFACLRLTVAVIAYLAPLVGMWIALRPIL